MLETELLTLEERKAYRTQLSQGLGPRAHWYEHSQATAQDPRRQLHQAVMDSPNAENCSISQGWGGCLNWNPCFTLYVHYHVIVILPGKLFLSKFIMGKVSSKCRRGSVLLTCDYIRMNNWLLSPGVTPRPQKKIRVDYYAPHSTRTIKISFDRKLNPQNWS